MNKIPVAQCPQTNPLFVDVSNVTDSKEYITIVLVSFKHEIKDLIIAFCQFFSLNFYLSTIPQIRFKLI